MAQKKSPPANAHTFADGDFPLRCPSMAATFIAAAIRKTQKGCHAAAYSSSLSCVWIYVFFEVLLRIFVGFKKSILYLPSLFRPQPPRNFVPQG